MKFGRTFKLEQGYFSQFQLKTHQLLTWKILYEQRNKILKL